jgi:hypothetical protein
VDALASFSKANRRVANQPPPAFFFRTQESVVQELSVWAVGNLVAGSWTATNYYLSAANYPHPDYLTPDFSL